MGSKFRIEGEVNPDEPSASLSEPDFGRGKFGEAEACDEPDFAPALDRVPHPESPLRNRVPRFRPPLKGEVRPRP